MIQGLLDLLQIQIKPGRKAVQNPAYGRSMGFAESSQAQYSSKCIHPREWLKASPTDHAFHPQLYRNRLKHVL